MPPHNDDVRCRLEYYHTNSTVPVVVRYHIVPVEHGRPAKIWRTRATPGCPIHMGRMAIADGHYYTTYSAGAYCRRTGHTKTHTPTSEREG
eukprot:scaffold5946_cov169-Amphora_coffeaeformis.AAC.2